MRLVPSSAPPAGTGLPAMSQVRRRVQECCAQLLLAVTQACRSAELLCSGALLACHNASDWADACRVSLLAARACSHCTASRAPRRQPARRTTLLRHQRCWPSWTACWRPLAAAATWLSRCVHAGGCCCRACRRPLRRHETGCCWLVPQAVVHLRSMDDGVRAFTDAWNAWAHPESLPVRAHAASQMQPVACACGAGRQALAHADSNLCPPPPPRRC